MKTFRIVISILCFAIAANAADRVYPTSDLSYVGAFRANTASPWISGGHGIAIDGSTGEMIMVGNYSDNSTTVAKFATPDVVNTRNPSLLNPISTIGSFVDITGGHQTSGLEGTELKSISYLPQQDGQSEDKFYWIMYIYYDVTGGGNTDGRIGWAGTDLEVLDSDGAWGLSGYGGVDFDRYILPINTTWADANVNGKYLGVGRQRTGGSRGPSLFATAPWEDNGGLPPVNDYQLASEQLIYYDVDHPCEYFSYVGEPTAGAWVTIAGKQSFVVYSDVCMRMSGGGTKFWQSEAGSGNSVAYKDRCGLSTTLSTSIDSDDTSVVLASTANFAPSGFIKIVDEHISYSGISGNTLTGCLRGQHSSTATSHSSGSYAYQLAEDTYAYEPNTGGYSGIVFVPMLCFYDVDQIAEISAGTRSAYNIQPYAYLSLDKYFFRSKANGNPTRGPGTTGGMYFDPSSSALWVVERLGYAYNSNYYPIIHKFTLSDIGSSLDTSPPSAPSNAVVSGTGVLSWTDSSDAMAEYMIYKFYDYCCSATDEYRPIGLSVGSTWTDPAYNAGDKYMIVAYDQSMNESIAIFTDGYSQPTITIQDALTYTSSATITGEYTKDDALTAICTWSHSSGSVTGFATVLLGVVSGTVTGLPVGSTSVSFELVDSAAQVAEDDAVFTCSALSNTSKGVTIQGVQWNQ